MDKDFISTAIIIIVFIFFMIFLEKLVEVIL